MLKRSAALVLMLAATLPPTAAFAGSGSMASGGRASDSNQAQKVGPARATRDRDGARATNAPSVKEERNVARKLMFLRPRGSRDGGHSSRSRKHFNRNNVIGYAVSGAVGVGLIGGWAALNVHDSAQKYAYDHPTPYAVVENAAAGSTDEAFNNLAKQVPRVAFDPSGNYGGGKLNTDVSRPGFHNLVDALMSGKLGQNPTYFKKAIEIGRAFSADVERTGGRHRPAPTDQIAYDTARLQVTLADMTSQSNGPSAIPSGVAK